MWYHRLVGNHVHLLCDSGCCVHKSDVQNEWDDNTHTLNKYTHRLCTLTLIATWVHQSGNTKRDPSLFESSSIYRVLR